MHTSTFGYIFNGNELLVGTAGSLAPYIQEACPQMYNNIDKLFHSLHPFAMDGTPLRFLSDAAVLKAPWAAYDLCNNHCFLDESSFFS
ncbi:hypothetical protein CHL76_09005 [Marinococcus halophilus]|uniref:Uncharacterized protein n=1 Tax=Marinococcus halophilus TaxID=1371 RepID=A0A510Y4M3_MARHA|nr:hypothetical protein [Marinococcus halophilus]OZT80234.1 hypothetical protein CHL76_09005 [Marinococcus halophilus]GEK58290.1 hypothetical protein MHA01_11950 [Marinococcus halophilus]